MTHFDWFYCKDDVLLLTFLRKEVHLGKFLISYVRDNTVKDPFVALVRGGACDLKKATVSNGALNFQKFGYQLWRIIIPKLSMQACQIGFLPQVCISNCERKHSCGAYIHRTPPPRQNVFAECHGYFASSYPEICLL